MFRIKALCEGIEKCISNAESLIDDAKLLKANDRKERAYCLYQYAGEEIGKASLILQYMILENLNDVEKYKLFKKNFTDHKSKTKNFISYDYFVFEALKTTINNKREFIETTINEFSNLDLSNTLKNHSLYTSIIKEEFFSPSD